MNIQKTDILLDWHPIMIARMIRLAIGERQQKDAAKALGITPQYLCDILQTRRLLSPEVAAKLYRISLKLDGCRLYTMQEKRRVEIQFRYETGELERPAGLLPVKQKESNQTNKLSVTAYRKRSLKGWETRKRQKRLREAAAVAGKMDRRRAA